MAGVKAFGADQQHSRCTKPIPPDAEMHKRRHLIENCFCKLKELKRRDMGARHANQSFEAMIHIAAAIIISR